MSLKLLQAEEVALSYQLPQLQALQAGQAAAVLHTLTDFSMSEEAREAPLSPSAHTALLQTADGSFYSKEGRLTRSFTGD